MPKSPGSGRGQGRSRRRRGREAPALSPAEHRATAKLHSCFTLNLRSAARSRFPMTRLAGLTGSGLPALESLGLEPERLHLVEIGAFRLSPVFGETMFDMAEAALEFGVGGAQGGLGLDLEMAGEVYRGEKEVADLVRELCGRAAADLGLDLG